MSRPATLADQKRDPKAKSPWREVIHIHRQKGARGGEVWFLTLACGHHKAVRIPKFKPERDMIQLHLHGKKVRQAKFEAPERCRCPLCLLEGKQASAVAKH